MTGQTLNPRKPRLLIGAALLAACVVPVLRSALAQAPLGPAPASDARQFVNSLILESQRPPALVVGSDQPEFLMFRAEDLIHQVAPQSPKSPAPRKAPQEPVRLTPSLLRRIVTTIAEKEAAQQLDTAAAPAKTPGQNTASTPAPITRRIPAKVASQQSIQQPQPQSIQRAPQQSIQQPTNSPVTAVPSDAPRIAKQEPAQQAPAPTPREPATQEPLSTQPVEEAPQFGAWPGLEPHSACSIRCGVMCGPCDPCSDRTTWDAMAPIPWESLAQGEYIGPARLPHVPEYRLRVDDELEFVFRLTRDPSPEPYRINVGDTLRIESLTAENLNRDVIVQPDGTITVANITQVRPDGTTSNADLGQVPAAGRTIEELRNDLIARYKSTVAVPSITVTPISLDSRLEELRATVDARAGSGGQARRARVTPEGTIQLPAIGSVPAQGLTLDELKFEIEQRYSEIVSGLEITPILIQRAPRFIYITGEVRQPGRYELVAPTTLMQAIALAGSWNVGADLENIVILRRDENWQLMATKVNLHYALFGHKPCPAGEIWLRDSDIVLLPKHPLLWTDDLIELLFTRGLYGMFPVSYSVMFNRASTL